MLNVLITLFNPDHKSIENINAIARQADRTILCDNSPQILTEQFEEGLNIVYRFNDANLGLSRAFNKVLKDDSESYEYIGYCRGWDGKDRYICWAWTGLHEDVSTIGMLVFYTPDGKYLGNIQRDLSAGTSTSSHNSPYYVPGEPINKK